MDVLKPVDEFVAAATRFALLGVRRRRQIRRPGYAPAALCTAPPSIASRIRRERPRLARDPIIARSPGRSSSRPFRSDRFCRSRRRSRATTGSTPPRSSPCCGPRPSTPGAARRPDIAGRITPTSRTASRRGCAHRRVRRSGLLGARDLCRTVDAADRRALHLASGRALLRPAGDARTLSLGGLRRAYADRRALFDRR